MAVVYTQCPPTTLTVPQDLDPPGPAIVWGKDLAEAKARGLEFLDKLVLGGTDSTGVELKSNVEFLRHKTEKLLVF